MVRRHVIGMVQRPMPPREPPPLPLVEAAAGAPRRRRNAASLPRHCSRSRSPRRSGSLLHRRSGSLLIPPARSMLFEEGYSPQYVRNNYLLSITCLRSFLNDLDHDNSPPLIAAGMATSCNAKPRFKGEISDSIMTLAMKYAYEYRVPDQHLDSWELKRVNMDSAAGDPDFTNLFLSQLHELANLSSRARESRGFIQIHSAFAMTLACAFVAFADCASAEDIHAAYLSWPIVHGKNVRQKPAAGSASKTRQKPHAGSAYDRPNSHRVPTNHGHSWSEACSSRNIYLSFDGASFGAVGDAIPSSVFFTGDGTTSIATPSS